MRVPGAAAHAGLPEQAGQPHPFALEGGHDRDLLRDLTAPDLPHPFEQRGVTGRAENLTAVLAQQEAHGGMGHGVKAHEPDDVGGLGFLRLEELQASRHGMEEIGDLDAGADRHPVIARVRGASAEHQDLGSGRLSGGAGLKGEPGHAGDRGNGLPAEAEGRDAVEVGGDPDLARGMPQQAQGGLLRGHAASVVLDHDQRLASP